MIARSHVIRAVAIAFWAGVLAAIVAAIVLPLDREARSVDGRLEAFADTLAAADVVIEDSRDLQIDDQSLEIVVTDDAATCETWSETAAEVVALAEASDLAHYHREIRVRDANGGVLGIWYTANSDDADAVEAASAVCGIAGVQGYEIAANGVVLYGDVTRAAVAEAATLVEESGLLLLQRYEPEV